MAPFGTKELQSKFGGLICMEYFSLWLFGTKETAAAIS
jgi:hypothetical protein